MTNPDGMSERPYIPGFPESHITPQPNRVIERDMRVRHWEYGDGTVVAVVATGVMIRWDKPFVDSTDTLVYDVGFVAGLERL